MTAETMLKYLKNRFWKEIRGQLLTIDDNQMSLKIFVKLVQDISIKFNILAKRN